MFNFFNKKTKKEQSKTKLEISSRKFVLSSYLEVTKVAEILIKEKKVFVYLETVEKLERRRIIDFLSGIIFVMNGKVKKIKPYTYVFYIN